MKVVRYVASRKKNKKTYVSMSISIKSIQKMFETAFIRYLKEAYG